MLRSPAAAEDAAQDAMISAWRALDGYRGGNFPAWLMRIASNRCRDELRRRKRRPSASLDLMIEEHGDAWSPPDEGRSPELAALDAETGRTSSPRSTDYPTNNARPSSCPICRGWPTVRSQTLWTPQSAPSNRGLTADARACVNCCSKAGNSPAFASVRHYRSKSRKEGGDDPLAASGGAATPCAPTPPPTSTAN